MPRGPMFGVCSVPMSVPESENPECQEADASPAGVSQSHIWIPDLGKLTSCLLVLNPWLPRARQGQERCLLPLPCPPAPRQGATPHGAGVEWAQRMPHVDSGHKTPALGWGVGSWQAGCVSGGLRKGRGSHTQMANKGADGPRPHTALGTLGGSSTLPVRWPAGAGHALWNPKHLCKTCTVLQPPSC